MLELCSAMREAEFEIEEASRSDRYRSEVDFRSRSIAQQSSSVSIEDIVSTKRKSKEDVLEYHSAHHSTRDNHFDSLKSITNTTDSLLNMLDKRCEKLEKKRASVIKERLKANRHLQSITTDTFCSNCWFKESEGVEETSKKIKELGNTILHIDRDLEGATMEGEKVQKIFDEVTRRLKKYASEAHNLIDALDIRVSNSQNEVRVKDRMIRLLRKKINANTVLRRDLDENDSALQASEERCVTLRIQVDALKSVLADRQAGDLEASHLRLMAEQEGRQCEAGSADLERFSSVDAGGSGSLRSGTEGSGGGGSAGRSRSADGSRIPPDAGVGSDSEGSTFTVDDAKGSVDLFDLKKRLQRN